MHMESPKNCENYTYDKSIAKNYIYYEVRQVL